jgi:hypothetical protein
MSNHINDTQEPTIDLAAAEQALTRLEPTLRALPAEQVIAPRFNARRGAISALRMVRRARQSDLRPRFEALIAAGELTRDALEALETAALALWHARRVVDEMTATHSEAQLPESLVADATATRARMLKVLEFHYADDPAIGPMLAHIRSGSGYADLAEDLVALSKLYRTHRAEIEHTPKHYSARDGRHAADLAGTIATRLTTAGSNTLENATELLHRASTHFAALYDEVQATGAFLLRRDPAAATTAFPGLYSIARGGRRAATPDEPHAPGGSDDEKK